MGGQRNGSNIEFVSSDIYKKDLDTNKPYIIQSKK